VADNSLKVHIPQEANPDALIPLIDIMYEGNLTFPNVKSLREFAHESGLGDRTELQGFATVCGLLHKDEKGSVSLSSTGNTLAQFKRDLRADLIHFIMYTGWATNSRDKTELWAYREIVDFLWSRNNLDVLSITSSINEEVRNKAFELFEEDVSFSPKSIRGARKWLEAVSPPVIESNLFNRRYFCSPELMALSIGWVVQQTEGELNIDFLLTPKRREMVCKVCLLEPSALDRALDWTLPLYPTVMAAGTSAGVYGRFLRLLKWPEMSDLLP
jgi:hypothetical protein